MTEAWDEVVAQTRADREMGRVTLGLTYAGLDAILQGQAEIERLRVHADEAARNAIACLEMQEAVRRENDRLRRELAELKAAAPSRPDREALAGRLREHARLLEATAFDGINDSPAELLREAAYMIDRLETDAIPPAAPAAIVEDDPDGDEPGHFHLFARCEDAEQFLDDAPKEVDRLITYVRGWHYHPAAPGESGEAGGIVAGLEVLREAGGKAWDDVADPAAYLGREPGESGEATP